MTKRELQKSYERMLTPITGKQMQKAPLVKTAWLVDSMIPARGVTLLHGPTTAGKSALTWAIANAVQIGEPLFGLRTVKTEVLFVSLDMAEDPLKMRWFGTQDTPKTREAKFNPEFSTIFPTPFPFIEENKDGDSFRAAFKCFIKPYGLIIIDALGRFVGDTISAPDATRCYKYLSEVLDEKACILIHHDGKKKGKSSENGSKASSDDYSGTKRWIDFAQHQLHLMQSSTETMRILQQGKSQLAPERHEPWKLRINDDGKMCLYDEAQIARDILKRAVKEARRKIPGFNKLKGRKRQEALGQAIDKSDRHVRTLIQKAEQKSDPKLSIAA